MCALDTNTLGLLIVEDQTMVRELLAIACRQVAPKADVRQVGSAKGVLDECAERTPDLILLDLVLPDGDGLALLPEIFARAPGVKVIALSSHIDEVTLHRALGSRVHGILDKNEQPIKVLGEAINTVMAGGQYMSSAVQRLRASLRADPNAFDKILSDREQEALRLIGEGMSNDEVAEKLKISASTAKNHRLNIMAKLGIHSTPQLIRYAIEKGFTRVPEGGVGKS
ncbi:DNA-binding response regulator [Ereboglobus luteus]|uniref:DNA-binding response regulator n=2 Tax=Ereboglobus luteus TaxID=1796921 RepID=A0A2U8E642_9BACT|nr:response regulator transcription factor [Ereboglobus luteus]AWI10280.1 DNA-binding response regulator [Ereboglobus luteus]